jgi:hypothetical protein
MLSKGLIESVEELWSNKNKEIYNLNCVINNREKHIKILVNEIMKLNNFKCIHENGEYERGHRYCDDKCPLVTMCNFTYKINNENFMLGIDLLCQRQKVWSK